MTTPQLPSWRSALALAVGGLALLFPLAGCASNGSPGLPGWVDSRSHPDYPDSKYLIGIGTASGLARDEAYQQARDRALADISGQLETHIFQQVESGYQEMSSTENGETDIVSKSGMQSVVKAVVSGSLKSIQPVEQRYDEASRTGAALVVVKKSDYARQAGSELSALSGKIESLVDEADRLTADSKYFQAARRYRSVEDLLITQSAIEAQLQFVMPGPRRGTGPSAEEVFRKRRQAAENVHLVLLCRHDAFGAKGSTVEFEQMFVPQFAKMGIAVTLAPAEIDGSSITERWDDVAFLCESFASETGQSLLFICEATSSSRPVGQDDLIGVRSSGSARLLDASSAELLITVSYSPDVAGHSPAIGVATKRDALVEQSLVGLAEHLVKLAIEQI